MYREEQNKMGRQFSTVIHTAKRTLKNPCEECWEDVTKGQKYYIRTYQYMGRKVEHVSHNTCAGCNNKQTNNKLCDSCKHEIAQQHRGKF